MLKPSKSSLAALLCAFTLAPLYPLPAHADVQSELEALEKRVDEQDKMIHNQQQEIGAQIEQVREQRKQIEALTRANAERTTATASARKKPPVQSATTQAGEPYAPPQQRTESSSAMTPTTAPSTEEPARPQIQALADQGGVLSPKGMLTYENTIEYTNTTRNLFTFNGVELAQVVLVGAISDSAARHQVVQETGRLRLGITNKLEGDVHVPYVYRNDGLTTTNTTTGSSAVSSLEGAGLGDIDAGLAYQLNKGNQGWPFLIGNVRYKANNADGPYDVPYNANNIATSLPTGTGFQTAEASITAIKISDPAVLFGNLGYVYDMSRKINRTFGTTQVGLVEPGDAINALVGMAFAINNETSFSLGQGYSVK